MKLKILSTVAAVALLSTAATAASQIDILLGADSAAIAIPGADVDVAGEVTGAVTVAKEVLVGATAEANLATETRSVVYQPDINMGQNSIIEITVTNGAVKETAGNVLYLSRGAEIGTMTDFLKDSNGNYTWMRFKITAAAGATSGEALAITETETGLAADAIKVVANQGLTKGSKVTFQVTLAKDDTGSSQTSTLTAAENIMEVVDGITASVVTPVTVSTIDVDASRTQFTGATTTSTSTAVAVATNGAEVGLVLDAAEDTYDLVIERSDCSGLDDVAGSITLGSGTAPADFNATDCKWQWTGDFTDATGAALAGAGDLATITVNGTDVLRTGDWKVSLTVEADEVLPAGTKITPLENETLLTWGINGSQFIVPYLHTQADYGTYVVVTNTSTADAEVSLDVYSDKSLKGGQTQASMACSNITLATIPANSTATYYPSDINSAIDATSGCANFSTTNERFMGQFSLVAPSNNIHAVAFQKDGINGKRSIPVLTNSGTHDWRE